MVRLGSFTLILPLSFDPPPPPHTHTHTHTRIHSVFQVQFLHNSAVVNESTAASSVNIPLGIQILIAPFATLQSTITVTLTTSTGSTATGAVIVTVGLVKYYKSLINIANVWVI